MKRFDLVVKTALLISLVQLFIRGALCFIEEITLRNAIGVLLYGYFTDLTIVAILSAPLFALSFFQLRSRFRKTLSLIIFMGYFLLIDACIILGLLNLFTWRLLKKTITLNHIANIADIVEIQARMPDAPLSFGIFGFFLIFLAAVNYFLWRQMIGRFWFSSRAGRGRGLLLTGLAVLFLTATKAGVNTISFPEPKRQESYELRKNVLFHAIREAISPGRAVRFSYQADDYQRFMQFIGRRPLKNKLYPILGEVNKKTLPKKTSRGRHTNIVLFLLSDFHADSAGCTKRPQVIAPFFNSLCREGTFAARFYANGFSPARSLLAVMCSAFPVQGGPVIRGRPGNSYLSLGRLFFQRGYHTAFFSGGTLDVDNIREFLKEMPMQTIVDRQTVNNRPGLEKPANTAVYDASVLSRMAMEMENSHGPFCYVFMSRSFNFVPKTGAAAPSSEMQRHRQYAEFISNADRNLSVFFRSIRKLPVFKNTLFVFTGIVPVSDGTRTPAHVSTLTERQMRVPFLLYTPGAKTGSGHILPVGSHVDILPTLCALKGIVIPNPWMGRNLLAVKDNGRAYLADPETGTIAICSHHRKWVYFFKSNRLRQFHTGFGFIEKEIPLDAGHDALRRLVLSISRVNATLHWKNRIYPPHTR